jgi:hypothetical protein
MKSLRRSSRRRRSHKTNKRHEKWQSKQNGKEKLKTKIERARKSQTQKLPMNQTPPTTLNATSPPYVDIIMLLLSTTQLARVQPTLCTISPPLVINSSNTN